MNDDLLGALGRHQRESLDAAPEPLDDDDPLFAAAQPLAVHEQEALLDAVFARVDPSAGASSDASREPSSGSPASSEPSAPVIDLAARRRRTLSVVFALAAALVLAIGVMSLLDRGPSKPAQLAVLPAFATSELRGGQALTRSDDRPGALTMAADDELDWIITPASPPRDAFELGLVIEPSAGEGRWLTTLPATITDSGVIRIRAALDELAPLTPGDHALTLVIAEQGQLPRDLDSARTNEAVQRVAIQITIVPTHE